MAIGGVGSEQTRRDSHSHGCTKSPARKSRIAAGGEQMRADEAANNHRDSDQCEFGDVPFSSRRRAQRAPLVTSRQPEQLDDEPHERDDGHDVSRPPVRGRDGQRSAEDAHRENEPGWGRRTTNRSVMCLASGLQLLAGRPGRNRPRRLSFHTRKLARQLATPPTRCRNGDSRCHEASGETIGRSRRRRRRVRNPDERRLSWTLRDRFEQSDDLLQINRSRY